MMNRKFTQEQSKAMYDALESINQHTRGHHDSHEAYWQTKDIAYHVLQVIDSTHAITPTPVSGDNNPKYVIRPLNSPFGNVYCVCVEVTEERVMQIYPTEAQAQAAMDALKKRGV